MRRKFAILTISFCALLLILNNHVIAEATGVQQLTQEQIEAFRAAKTVRVVINTNVPSLPFGEVSRKVLEKSGLKIVLNDDDPCDVTLEIIAKGTARSSRYETAFRENQKRQYSGAILNGRISYFTETRPGYFKNFKGVIDPPISIKRTYPTPESAPFDKAFERAGSFVSTLIDLMRDIYGVHCLLAYLEETDEAIRTHALSSLGRSNDINSVDTLIEALGNDDYQVRLKAVEALKNIKDSRAVEPLIAALGDNDPEVREAAVVALGDIKDSRAAEPLIATLGDNDPEVREAAVKALGELGDSRAFDALVAILQDNKSTFHRDAIQALGKIDDPRVFDLLVTTMKDKDLDQRIRDEAAWAMAELGEPRAREILFACLKDDDVGLREAAVGGIYLLTSPRTNEASIVVRAMEALIFASGDEEWDVNDTARFYLFQKSKKRYYGKNTQKKYQKWWDKNKTKYLKKK